MRYQCEILNHGIHGYKVWLHGRNQGRSGVNAQLSIIYILKDSPYYNILISGISEMYYSGEALGSDQPQAFTCPFCGKMGFTEHNLQEHVTCEHADSSIEVVSIIYVQICMSRS